MLATLLNIDLLGWPFLAGCAVFGSAVVALLIVGSWGRLAQWHRWLIRLVILASVGLITGWVLGWMLSDVWNTFGVALSTPTRLWICITLASLGIAIGNLWTTRWWAKLVAVATIPVLVLTGSLAINANIGEFRTIGDAVVGAQVPPLTLPRITQERPSSGPLWASWESPSGMPSRGQVGTVTIPGTVSHFSARSAIVYLPPAALVAAPPSLPVLIVLSGQPGQPSDIINKAGFAASLDAFARKHHGLAPIVVIPDQLGETNANPMCVDSPLGNSESYLTIDVPSWIKHHLSVITDRDDWAIAGFSQGGTCALQLGAGHPELFGSLFDISGELAPRHGSPSSTIDLGFGGSMARFEAATPLAIMSNRAPYADTVAIFAVGQDDSRFGPNQRILSSAATRAGMTTTTFEVPSAAHDWHCATAALVHGLTVLASRFGLESK